MTTIEKMTKDRSPPALTRRGFVIGGAAGGLVIGLGLPSAEQAAAQTAGGTAADIGLWVRIRPDDGIVVRMARSEMGQGTITGLAQLVVEELEGDWKKVSYDYVTPGESAAHKRAWGDFGTVGSRGIRMSHEYVRQGGAVARAMLIQAAADEWKVPATECKAENSVITHPSGTKTTYGKVAAAAAKLPVPDPKSVTLKDPMTWKVAGKGLARLDTPDKLVGKQIYSLDLKLPGMLIAAVRNAPVHGNKVASVDDAAAKAMTGVKGVVRVGETGVAVIADTYWHAKTALEKVGVTYEDTPNSKVDQKTIVAALDEGLTATDGVFVGNRKGDFAKAIEGAAKKVEATYYVPFVHHATMEPQNTTAKWTPERCEVWCPTQNGEAALAAASGASGLPLDKCEVYKQLLGGGFGRRGAAQDYVAQAVLIAKQMPGVPIKMIWSREEDMLHGFYRPIGKAKMTAGLDDKGELESLHIRIAAPSILRLLLPQAIGKDVDGREGADIATFQGMNPGGTEGPFGYNQIPNLLVDHAMRISHVPVGFWRGVNNNQNAIFVECFIDEVAKAAGKDPLEFRRAMLKGSPKHLGVLNAVCEQGGYGKPLPDGVFRGISQMSGYGSYCAALAEVSVSPRGKLKIHRLVMGSNAGHVVNPEQVKCQIEGSVAYGLSALLYQQNTVEAGHMVETNFDNWPVLRIDEMPKIESVIVPTYDFWGGVGEPTIMVAAPAVLNGIFHATGKMQRSMPLRTAKLRDA